MRNAKATKDLTGARKTARTPRRRPLRLAERTLVRDIMTPAVVTVRPDLTVGSLVELLLARGLSRVPVVDAEGQLVGVVAKTDVVVDAHLRGETSASEADQPVVAMSGNVGERLDGFHLHDPGVLVEDIMFRRVVGIEESATVAEAARLMARRQLHGLPVLSATSQVVGMISATDLVAWIAGL